MTIHRALLDQLTPLLGADAVLTGADVSGRAAGIWRKDFVTAAVLFRPANVAGVAAVLKACNERGQTVVTHGGLTGLAEGALAAANDVVLSTERLNQIEHIDPVNRVMRVQAGVPLQRAQEAAEKHGLQLALDLGARGSCTVGGNAATNAGGINVLRYGMAREQILGLEAVLADGTVVSSLNQMLKNNAGYDLKQLFIGSEGTLGVITRLVLRLRPLPTGRETALLACKNFEQVVALLAHLEAGLGGGLHAFELMWRNFYELVTVDRAPLDTGHAYYVLAEARGNDRDADHERFVNILHRATQCHLLEDALVCKSEAERDELWGLRENVELTLESASAIIFDVSLPLTEMEAYVQQVEQRLTKEWGGQARLWVFGHAGDGNLHLVVAAGNQPQAVVRERVERCVYEPLQQIGGSVSAEHGVGLEKKKWLHVCRNPAEIELMQRMKLALDPRGILNPGRIFDSVPAE